MLNLSLLINTNHQAVAAIAAVLAAIALLQWQWHGKKADPFAMEGKLPTPDSTLPILGNTLDAGKKHKDRFHDWLAEQSIKFQGKPWMLKVIGRPPTVIITSPDNLEDIVKRQVDNFPRGRDSQSVSGDFLGQGIIAADGQQWYFQRKMSSHLFSMKMMQHVMHEVVREKVAILCDVLDTHVARGHPDGISLKQELVHFASDVFGKIGFGLELHCLESGLEGKTHEFVEAYAVASHATVRRFQLPKWYWKFQRVFGLGDEGKLRDSMKIVNDFVYKVISDSIAAKEAQAQQANTPPPTDLISLFLTASTEDREEITGGDPKIEMEFIRDMALNFIFAGKDTTSVAMCWFVVMMNRYPKVLQTIRAEIANKVPGLMNGAIDVPTIDDLKPLTYLEAAIRENMRLNAPAASTGRTAAADTILSDGTPIKKGTRVNMAIYASSRLPTVWGPDAAEFKPERWIDPEKDAVRLIGPPQTFTFGFGRRICPGRNMAMMEMKIALAVLLSRFNFKTLEDPFAITYELGITNPVKGPLLTSVSPVPPALSS